MINLNWEGVGGQLDEVIKAYADLPRHIAKKHLRASMRRALKPGVPILKRYTPKQKNRVVFGRDVVSDEYTARKVKGGGLRRAVTTKAKYVGTNKDGRVVGILGYKGGEQSRKAIWVEYGTSSGAKPVRMVERAMAEITPLTLKLLTTEMAKALEAAARDKAPGVAQAYRRT